MFNIKNIENNSEFMIRKEPSKIYSYTVLLIILAILFFIIGNFVYYNKSKSYIANFINYEDKKCLIITVSSTILKKLPEYKLTINNNDYDYQIVDIKKNDYDNNYVIIFSINISKELEKEKYFEVILKSEKTTFFKEIIKRIKEEFN